MNKTSSTVVTVLAVAALAVSLAAYSHPSAGSSENSLAKIVNSKAMNVCYAVWPPAVIKDASTGALSGHDIDAITLMAKSIGATVNWHETTFGDMAAAIQSGQCDMGTSLFVNIPAPQPSISRPPSSIAA